MPLSKLQFRPGFVKDATRDEDAICRANVSMSRAKFLQACVAAGVIEPSVAEEAASGVWPSAFDGFLTGLPVDKRIEAKATWVDGQRVRRDSPILALIAAEQGVTDEQLDEMFGITGG